MRRNFLGGVLLLTASLVFHTEAMAVRQVGGTPATAGQRGLIGITFREDGSQTPGITVEEVMDDAPAESAGIRPGDRIVRWNGRTDVAAAILANALQPGDTVRLRIASASGQERDVTIVAASPPPGTVMRVPGASREVIVMPWSGDPATGRFFRFDNDSLAIRMDSLNAEIRYMLRDSLGPRWDALRFDLPNVRVLPRDSVWMERLTPGRLRILSTDSAFYEPFRDGSLGIAIAAGRNAVAGAELADITPGLSSYFGTDQGALVLRVAPETPAARAGLRDGDVIVSAGGQTVAGAADLRWALSRPGARDVSIEILRRGARQTLTLGQ